MSKSKIRLGLVWHSDGFRIEVTKMFKNGKCRITETWIAEDTGKFCKHTSNQIIVEDSNGNEYCYDPKYEEYANPHHDGEDEYKWWARKYACGADNYKDDEDNEDDAEYEEQMMDATFFYTRNRFRERDEWDDLWDDRARSCGARMF